MPRTIGGGGGEARTRRKLHFYIYFHRTITTQQANAKAKKHLPFRKFPNLHGQLKTFKTNLYQRNADNVDDKKEPTPPAIH